MSELISCIDLRNLMVWFVYCDIVKGKNLINFFGAFHYNHFLRLK
jgi:hypothetical protein